jgi:MoxR-like ATPase
MNPDPYQAIARRLGIVGLDVETLRPILSVVMMSLGEIAPSRGSLLLIGSKGTGKTVLARRLALSMGERLSPMASFSLSLRPEIEDFLGVFGFTGEGEDRKLQVIPTQSSLLHARSCFLDEVSYVEDEGGVKRLLGLLGSSKKQILGIELVDLVFVVAACNPSAAVDPLYAGSRALSTAEADRFLVSVTLKEPSQLSPEDLRALLALSDAEPEDLRGALLDLEARVQDLVAAQPPALIESLLGYSASVVKSLRLSGRRGLGLVSLLRYAHAVEEAVRSTPPPSDEWADLWLATLRSVHPARITSGGMPPPEAELQAAHHEACATLKGYARFRLPQDGVDAARILAQRADDLSLTELKAGLTELIRQGDDQSGVQGATALVGLLHLARGLTRKGGEVRFGPDDTFRILERVQRALTLCSSRMHHVLSGTRLDLSSRRATALRLALASHPQGNPDEIHDLAATLERRISEATKCN